MAALHSWCAGAETEPGIVLGMWQKGRGEGVSGTHVEVAEVGPPGSE